MPDERSLNPFYRLSPFIREYIYNHNWQTLRPVQAAACQVLFDTDYHLLLASGTASGKTEAAFFPILSDLYENPPATVGALYIAPLKALINDQFERLGELCEESGIPVFHWHGDVSQSEKDRLVKSPAGILQITPESLQALILRRHNLLVPLFADLRYVVVDEMHAFMRNDRGLQVLALIEQLERLSGSHPRRIGLSATVGDVDAACAWLSAGSDRETAAPELPPQSAVWRLSMEHFTIDQPLTEHAADAETEAPRGADAGYSYIFERCTERRGASKSLIFAGSREEAEVVCATLRQYSEAKKIPDRFLIHHGNLSTAIREDAEARMKDETAPCHTVTTATLELGIDIGKLERAFQLDSPATVSSFLQRMGRTGRRGLPPEMRFVFREEPPEDRAPLPQLFPWKLLQGIAIVALYAEDRFVEPPRKVSYPFSLLYHQTLSILSYSGELLPSELARKVLSLAVFREVSQEDYKLFLRHLIGLGHIEVTAERGLIVGVKAEKIVNNYKFFATFQESEEFSVHSGSEELGTVVSPPPVGERLAIAGRVWDIKDIDIRKKQVFVTPVKGVVPAFFGLCPGDIHTRVLEKMREVLISEKDYPYLRPSARNRLSEARKFAAAARLGEARLVPLGGDAWCLFPWLGTYAFMACERILKIKLGADCKAVESSKPYFIQFKSKKSYDELVLLLRDAGRIEFDPESLIYPKEIPVFDKFDEYVPIELLRKHFAHDVLDLSGAQRMLSELE